MEAKIINDPKVVIEVINFSKKYSKNKNYSVKGASFKINQGELHGFIGANGAGKTTTIKSIVGAYARFEGQILINGIPNNKREAKETIGYIPEVAKFPVGFTTSEYLKHMAMLSGLKAAEAKVFAKAKIAELGLETVARRSPNNLSSGQKKKVLLAQSLIHNPKVIIMDEPAANLDPKARDEFFETLQSLVKKGVTIFISSHILDELQKYVDSITIIDGGMITYSGKIANAKKSTEAKNDNQWILKTFDTQKTKDMFAESKIDFKFENQTFEFTSTPKEVIKFFEKLVLSGITITSLGQKGSDLTSIYKDFVKKGSLDTGKGGNNA